MQCCTALHLMILRLWCMSVSQALVYISACGADNLVVFVKLIRLQVPPTVRLPLVSQNAVVSSCLPCCTSFSAVPAFMCTLLPIHFRPVLVAPIVPCNSYSGSHTACILQFAAWCEDIGCIKAICQTTPPAGQYTAISRRWHF